MTKKIDLIQLKNSIESDLNIEPDLLPGNAALEELRSALSDIINQMLDSDFERLLLLLYRIDVNEEKVKKALSLSKPGTIGQEIADLVIERELQKIETRQKYKS